MTVKKNPKLDLEKRRKAFFQIGLLFVASAALVAFEWDTFSVKNLYERHAQVMNEEIYADEREEKKEEEVVRIKPEPPKPEEKPQIDVQVFDPLTAQVTDREITTKVAVDVPNIPDVKIGNNAKPPVNTGPDAFRVVEESPQFIGNLNRFLSSKVQYPQVPLELGIQGTVYVEFIVSKTGAISNAKIVRSVDPDLDAEALRVIKSMPKWKPGKQRGRAVNVYYTIPINFELH